MAPIEGSDEEVENETSSNTGPGPSSGATPLRERVELERAEEHARNMLEAEKEEALSKEEAEQSDSILKEKKNDEDPNYKGKGKGKEE